MEWANWTDWQHGPHIGIFGFIIIIIFLNGIFSVFRMRAKRDIIREAVKSGQEIDPAIIESLSKDADDDDGSTLTGGLILMAVATGLVFLGYQIQKVEPDEKVFDIMLGVAGIPFLIGVVLIISHIATSGRRK